MLLVAASPAGGQARTEDDGAGHGFVEPERPGDGGEPTEIRIGLFVVDFKRIVDVDQTVVADYVLAMWWSDPRLASAEHDGMRTFRPSEIWTPFIQVRNIQRVFPQIADLVRVDNAGNCEQIQRFVGTLSLRLALREFPFDEQEIELVALSIGHTAEDVRLVVDEAFCGRSEQFTIVDWAIGEGTFVAGQAALREGEEGSPAFTASFPARRFANYFIVKIISPLVVIIAMSWVVFWINPGQFGPRVSVGVTSLLTLIAYRFLLGSLVPRVSYLTRLDIFIFFATLLVFVALIETLIVHSMMDSERSLAAGRLDRLSRLLFPTSFAALIVYAFVA